MTVDDITVKVTTIVLHEVQASVLLASPKAACFAAGADSEGRTDEKLCSAVAAALRRRNASWAERHMAVVAAAMRGRYKAMVMAMEDANLETVIIEDLVKFGEDRGRKKGLAQGRKQGIAEGRREEEREVLRLVFAERKLSLTPEQERQIDTCTDRETLRRWVKQAISAKIAAEALR